MPLAKRTTVHFDERLHQALHRKAAETNRSISELVNSAVRDALREIADDLADFDARAAEPVVGVDVLARRMTRRPTHPGQMLQEDFMPDYELTVASLAEALGVSRQSINELLRMRRAVSPEMALRLSRLFSNSAEFWLNAQRAVDLHDAEQAIRKEVARITPLRVA
jgi:addiction module HigA family antidote